MAKLKVTINDKKVQARLNALIKATSNMEPVYATIGRTLVNRIRLGFKTGIDPWGSPWAKLKFRQGQPLRDTGRLNRSIVAKADATGVTVGTNVEHARVHQYGATIVPKTKSRLVFPGPGGKLIFAKKVTIPARPFLPLRRASDTVALPPAWSKQVVSALRAYFTNATKGSA